MVIESIFNDAFRIVWILYR